MYYLMIFVLLFSGISEAGEIWTKYNLPATINCITGYGDDIWMGTENGVYQMNRYEGSYTVFTSDKDSLAEKYVTYIVSDKEGNIYAGSRDLFSNLSTRGGISFFNGVNWKVLKKNVNGLSGNDVRGLKIDKNGTVWTAVNDSYIVGNTDSIRTCIFTEAVQYLDGGNWITKKFDTQSIEAKGNWGMGVSNTFNQIICFDVIDSTYYAFFNRRGSLILPNGVASIRINDGQSINGAWRLTIEQIDKNNIYIYLYVFLDAFKEEIIIGKSDSIVGTKIWPVLSTPIPGLTHIPIQIIIDQSHNKWFVDRDESNNKYLIKYDDINYIPYTCPDWTPATEIKCLYADDQGFIWIGTQNDGLFRFDAKNATIVQAAHQTPTEFTLSSPYPNPFNALTTISFTLNKPGKVNLSIYSLTGQKVRELAAGSYSTGKHTAVWDGKNEKGEMVSSGVYLARLESGGVSKVVRMAMVK